jgi:acyl-CoA thioester hydrolase
MSKIATPSSTYTIRFNDCDLFGHLNNARYIDYFLNAREDHLKNYHEIDLSEFYKRNSAWVVGGHEIAYLRPAVYNEIVIIQSTLLQATEDFLLVEIQMKSGNQSHLKAIMRTRFVPINTQTGRKEPHDHTFLTWAKTIENTTIKKYETMQERIKELVLEKKN